jgi:hypothetical protein
MKNILEALGEVKLDMQKVLERGSLSAKNIRHHEVSVRVQYTEELGRVIDRSYFFADAPVESVKIKGGFHPYKPEPLCMSDFVKCDGTSVYKAEPDKDG